jgi:tetratricopeptide (TPR) repeat protein
MQMQCGSIHDLFRHFKEEENMQHFEALKSIDPSLMSQLLAREYVLEAQKSIDRMDARTHLSTALQLDPRCPEAFLELASISETPEAAMKWYDKCMSFIVNQLGSKKMDELMESFKANPWHQVELHCYMKAKVNLAEKLFREGYYEVANIHFWFMIEWDKNDEVCCRHFHAVSLLCENRLSETRSLLLKYPTDLSAQWYYIRAFLKFKQEGETRRSNRLLMRAFKRNLWAAIYVLGLQEMPMVEIKDLKNK